MVLNIASGLIIEEWMLNRVTAPRWQNRLLHALSEKYPTIQTSRWSITKPTQLQIILLDQIDSEISKMCHLKKLYSINFLENAT